MAQRSVKFGSMDLTVDGDKIEIGDKAPDFKAKANDLSDYNFHEEESGKVKLISVVPSLDTSVCELQTYLLSKGIKDLPENVVAITISNDLPFGQDRFAKDKTIENLKFISDYLYHEFANSYSTMINELNLLNRSIFVIDENNDVRYCEYLSQNTDLPDIDRAIEAVKSLI